MRDYISYLVRHRIRERPFSYLWFKAWAKRAINGGGLIGILYRSARLSLRGVKIGPLSVVGALTVNGRGSNLKIGSGCFIGSDVTLSLHDKIILGNNVVVNDGCVFLTGSHDVRDPGWRLTKAPITVNDWAWVARNAIILPGVTIGYGAVVGAGSVVTKDVPARSVVAGNPARVVSQRTSGPYSYCPVRFVAPFEAWVVTRHNCKRSFYD